MKGLVLLFPLLLSPFLSLKPVVANTDKDPIAHFASLEDPFRMRKVNLLWSKARTRLAESKLSTLYAELKLHDKEELTLKRVKAEAADKDGQMEADLRKKFNAIANKYGLSGTDAFSVAEKDTASAKDSSHPKAFFKDKKLNRLWEKAQRAGLTDEELMVLKQEFQHHQEKVNQYNQLLETYDALDEDKKDRLKNSIHMNDVLESEEKEAAQKTPENELDGKSRALKKDFERLHRLATNTANSEEFQDEKVQALWRLAQEADFDGDELESLQTELRHFEHRLQKMHHLEAEMRLLDQRHDGKMQDQDKTEGRKIMDKKLRKHEETATKMQKSLEAKIAARHAEL